MKSSRRFPSLAGLLAAASLAGLLPRAQAATYSLADDFSYTDNRTNSTWSYRMDDLAKSSPVFPLLTLTQRDANALWGSTFPKPPLMWSEASGYWGIGKNLTGQEQISTINGTHWAPGEVMLHPKAGASPAGLVIGWTAPSSMVVDLHYTFGSGSPQGNGIGYELIKRIAGIDTEVVALKNVGNSLTNDLNGITVGQGDQLFFRLNTSGEAVGDITRTDIKIQGLPPTGASRMTIEPAGGTVAAGSDFTFVAPATGVEAFQWRKDGQPIPGATNAHFRIQAAKTTDAGLYSVLVGSELSGDAPLNVSPKNRRPEPYASPVPKQVFSQILAEQENELKTNVLMRRFAESRNRLAADRYRPAYHFVSPESQMNDPNGLCFWQGRWHLFYQAYPPDEYPNPADIPKRRQHWGHAVSEDLVHWRDLPYAIYPGLERMCFSGSTVVESDRVVAFYPGISAGQMVAIASDPLLLNWKKLEACPVSSPVGDSCIWKESNTYFGLVGADNLVSSQDLITWTVHGAFVEANPFPLGDALACPGFVPIGGKHILLSFSHTVGSQYLLGDYNQQTHKFRPYARGRFNHGTVSPGGVHAPSAAADGHGGVINILNINDAKPSPDWDQIMSLAQRLTLGPDAQLRIEPVKAVATLRTHHQHLGQTVLPANQEIVLDAVKGNTLELDVEIDPQLSRWVQLNVLRSPHAEEQTSITFYNFNRKLSVWYDTKAVICLDPLRSSTSPDVWIRPPERTVVDYGAHDWASAPTSTTPGKPFRLRVFIDRSVVEVFVNEKHYLALRVYPEREDSIGVSLRAQGREALLKSLDAWEMNAIWD
jgi:beta-fructofuranosidase